MSILNMAKTIKQIHPDSCILYRNGAFFHAYGKDSIMLSGIFGYGIKRISSENIPTCGFPLSSINKIRG